MDEEGREQFYCVNGNDGHHWKVESMPAYDHLSKAVRQQLAQSPFNICPRCFDLKVRDIARLHPEWSHQKLLSAAIKVREHEIRSSEMSQRREQ
jgi:hypothetical protein